MAARKKPAKRPAFGGKKAPPFTRGTKKPAPPKAKPPKKPRKKK